MLNTIHRRQLTYEMVQDELKAYIIANNLKPGDGLPSELELVQRLGVSRNSIREAIKSLETLGILESRPGSGLFVRSFSFDPLLANLAYGLMFDVKALTDIIDVRFHLEYGMSEEALRTVTPGQIQRLDQVLAAMLGAAQNGQYDGDTDRRFHQVLWENVNNILLGKILDIFWMVHQESRRRASIADVADPLQTYHRHLAIAQALTAGDVVALKTAMREHYDGMRARLQKPAGGSTDNK